MTDGGDTLIVWHRWFPPRGDAEERTAIGAWKRHVTVRFQVSGGSVLGAMGGSAAAAFEPSDLTDVLTMALELLDEAETNDPPMHIAIGAAVGEIDDMMMGPAIERAENLAIRAKAGELVLDHGARELAADHFLLGRQVSAGAGSARGTTVDRVHPRRAEAAKGLAQLGRPVLPPIIESTKTELQEELEAGTTRTFILRGPVGAGASELIARLSLDCDEPQIVSLGAAPGGVVPLASFRLGMLLRIGTPEAVVESFLPIEEEAARALGRVAAGELVPLEELSLALSKLLAHPETRPWVVLSPLGLVDGATLAALLRAREVGGDFVLLGRHPIEPALPRPLAELEEPVHEVILPALKTSDAKAVAQAVLGEDTDEEVALRVAVLGGDTVIGVVEAARTSVANGDLVHDGGGFVWRTEPRSGADAVETEQLISERLQLLDGGGRQVLEAMCVAPDGSSRELIAKIAQQDGLTKEAFARGLDALRRQALAHGAARPRPASSLMRWRVVTLIPPERSTSLHRYVGEALREGPLEHTAQRAELAYYLVEGGLLDEGRPLVATVVEELLDAGYERAARQLSGWLAAVGEADGDASEGLRTLPPTSLDEHEEGPPSSEIALEELLQDTSPEALALTEKPAGVPPPAEMPPPRRKPPPPPPPKEAIRRSRAVRTIPKGHAVRSIPKGNRAKPAPPPPPDARTSPKGKAPKARPPATPPETRPAAVAEGAAAAVTTKQPAPPVAEPAPSPDAMTKRTARAPKTELAATTEPAQKTEPAPEKTEAIAKPSPAPGAKPAAEPEPAAPIDDVPTAKSSAAPALDDLLTDDLAFFEPASGAADKPSSPFVVKAVDAIRRRDFRGLEAAIAKAEGDGGNAEAVRRVRAVADLAKGDLAAARKNLAEAEPASRAEPSSRARHQLALALLSLRDGAPVPGIRAGLASLAASRSIEDQRGEAAALKVIAACYRAVGRHEDAAQLEALA